MPRINYQAHNTRPYRYVYGTGNRLPGNFHDQLIKINVQDGWSKTWSEAECYPGEPVFVAASFLLILDAESFEERARAEVPHHIPFGLHGQYFGDLAQVITGDHPSVN